MKINVDLVYPIGSVYITTNNVNPSVLFGGTWEQIKGRFLLGTGNPGQNSDNYFGAMFNDHYDVPVNSTGGQEGHQLTIQEIPSHIHGLLLNTQDSYVSGSALQWTVVNNGRIYNGDSMSYTGGSQYHNNMPPYYGVYMWRRTA